MDLKNKTIVVTGAGSGIGRCLVGRFAEAGARTVIASDINSEGAAQTATMYDAIAQTTDVANEADLVQLIETTERDHGPIDLFCSNAGIARGRDEQAPDDAWNLCWNVNVMAHVHAARHLVPRMIERGGGYFLNTVSAAGLLNQIGGAPYGVTKHAAIGFGEWLALSYKHQGIKVSLLCPQAVNTPMTMSPDENAGFSVSSAAQDGMIEPELVADCTLQGLKDEAFLILPHPEVANYMQRKSSDYDRWISGMNRLHLALADTKN